MKNIYVKHSDMSMCDYKIGDLVYHKTKMKVGIVSAITRTKLKVIPFHSDWNGQAAFWPIINVLYFRGSITLHQD